MLKIAKYSIKVHKENNQNELLFKTRKKLILPIDKNQCSYFIWGEKLWFSENVALTISGREISFAWFKLYNTEAYFTFVSSTFVIMLLVFCIYTYSYCILAVSATCRCLSIKRSTRFVVVVCHVTLPKHVRYIHLTSFAKTCKIDGLLFHFTKWVRSLHIAIFFCMQFACVAWYCIRAYPWPQNTSFHFWV